MVLCPEQRSLIAGFVLSADGYQVDGSITDAISNFPTPATRLELRSFVGLLNQLSASTPIVATLLNPLHPLAIEHKERLFVVS